MKFYKNGKKTTKKAFVEYWGKESAERMITSAKEYFQEECDDRCSFMGGWEIRY